MRSAAFWLAVTTILMVAVAINDARPQTMAGPDAPAAAILPYSPSAGPYVATVLDGLPVDQVMTALERHVRSGMILIAPDPRGARELPVIATRIRP